MRCLWSILAAMAAAKMTVDAVAEAWPTMLVAGVLGGLCFAALGALSLRA